MDGMCEGGRYSWIGVSTMDTRGPDVSFSANRSRVPVRVLCVSMWCSGCVRLYCRRRRQKSPRMRARRTKAIILRAMPTLAPTESPLDLEA